jgi:hypothetical protein
VQGAGGGVQGAGGGVQGAGCRVQGAGCRVQGAGGRGQGAGSSGRHVRLVRLVRPSDKRFFGFGLALFPADTILLCCLYAACLHKNDAKNLLIKVEDRLV